MLYYTANGNRIHDVQARVEVPVEIVPFNNRQNSKV